MKTYTEKVGNQLNQLIEKTYDAEKGFKKAAEHTDHTYLKEYFNKKAQQREQFGNQLKTEVISFGQEAETDDSLTSKAHRTWMDLKALFKADSEEAMLQEAIRGEKASIEEYENVLAEITLPPSTEILLRNQKVSIQAALSTVEKLEANH